MTGDGAESRNNRRVPGPIAASCSVCVANTRRSTAEPASTSAGKPRTAWPPSGALDDARQLVDVVGPGSQPGAFQFAGDRVGDGLPGRRGELLLQRVEVLAAGHLGAVGGFDGERHAQMRRQLVEVEGVDRHEHPGASPQLALQALQQRFSCRFE